MSYILVFLGAIMLLLESNSPMAYLLFILAILVEVVRNYL